jgi:hypothetical protein
MAETCAATANPALYCIEPDATIPTSSSNLSMPPPVDQEPATLKRPDATTFDIVKATQYGAIERVQELVS